MSAIKRLLQRWGYARLEEFGLLLTPDGRILATRPVVLDDGLGGCVVGWRDGDLAALELEPWRAPASQTASRPPVTATQRPASGANRMRDRVAPAPDLVAPEQRAIPDPVAPAQAPMANSVAPVQAAMANSVAPVQAAMADPVAPVQAAVLARVTAPTSPAIPDRAVIAQPIDPEPAEPPDEDEWEWEIVMARARVATEATEEPAAPPTVAAGSSRWLATTAFTELDDDTVVTPAARRAQRREPDLAMAPMRPSQRGENPKTVIPVPRLPAAADPAAMMRSMAPVRAQRSASRSVPAPRPLRRVVTRR
jgi:hypothetical protein